jgi:hypothetical protein
VDGAFGSFDAASQVDATKNDAPWLEELQREFGWQLMSTIMVAQHMFKGFVNTLLRSNWYYIVKQYSVPATRVFNLRGCGLPTLGAQTNDRLYIRLLHDWWLCKAALLVIQRSVGNRISCNPWVLPAKFSNRQHCWFAILRLARAVDDRSAN